MRIKGIEIEDFINYKTPSMFISMGTCDFKCAKDGNFDKSVCQNSLLARTEDRSISNERLVELYVSNPITKAIVIGGMEPFTYWEELSDFIKLVRSTVDDEIIIYTGYYPNEISDKLLELVDFNNIIIKFGRFIPNSKKKFDKVLGIELASDNQYAYRLNTDSKDTIKALIENDGYCPCMVKKNENTKCSCLAFRNKESGNCHCGIFNKGDDN